MTKVQNLAALKASGQALPILSRADLLASVASMFMQRGNEQFTLLNESEKMPLKALRAMTTAGNILGAVEQTIIAGGAVVDGTIGGVMDALNLDERQIHELACACHTHSSTIHGSSAAYRVNQIR